MTDAIELHEYRGAEVEQCLDALADLRMTVFREWPYLYAGDIEYERRYLDVYVGSPRSVALVACIGGQPVGATTAMPLADEDPALQQPFSDRDFDLKRVFYNGESILLPQFRGRGLYRTFFEARERHACSFGDYDWIAFCAVQRPADHPQRPADYRPLDPIWRRYGYAPRPDLVAWFPWRDIGADRETGKPLRFWLKSLA